MQATIAGVIILLLIIAGGWYFYVTQPSTTSPAVGSTTPATTLATSTEPIIGDNLALGLDSTTTLGAYLIGYTGMTVYAYTNDSGATSTCYDQCAQKWPPYVVSPSDNIQQLELGVNGTVGTTERQDGSLQLTYNGHPLYFYSGDKTGADVSGNGVGGAWHVVKP